MTSGRAVAATVLWGTYILVMYLRDEGWAMALVFYGAAVLPLIWWPDVLGGPWSIGRGMPAVGEESPPILVEILGWILLLLPVVTWWLSQS